MEFVDDLSTLALDSHPGVSGRVVDVHREIPAHWASVLVDKGFTKPDGSANVSALAAAAGTNPETTFQLLLGNRKSREDVITKVAKTLGVKVTEVSAWSKISRTVEEPYRPPDLAHRMTARQRAAIDLAIAAMVEPEERAEEATVTPIRPAVPKGIAARKQKGPSRGQQIRRQQDTEGEAP